MLGLLTRLLDRLVPKKRAPIKIPIRDYYEIERDAYLDELLSRMEQKTQTVDADMYDKL